MLKECIEPVGGKRKERIPKINRKTEVVNPKFGSEKMKNIGNALQVLQILSYWKDNIVSMHVSLTI